MKRDFKMSKYLREQEDIAWAGYNAAITDLDRRRAADYAFRVSQTVLEWKAASGRERKRAVSYAVRAGDRSPSARLCREDWLSFPWRFTL